MHRSQIFDAAHDVAVRISLGVLLFHGPTCLQKAAGPIGLSLGLGKEVYDGTYRVQPREEILY